MKHGQRGKIILACVTVALLSDGTACRQDKPPDTAGTTTPWNRDDAQRQFVQVQTELNLATAEKPYLVFNFKRNRLDLKLRGTVVWDAALDYADGDTTLLEEFIEKFTDKKDWPVRAVERVHLFEATRKMPDSLIAIVAEATNTRPDNLQRMLPERFRISWYGGLALEVVSDIEGAPVSILGNSFEEMRKVISQPLGGKTVVIKLGARQAITLYGACKPGLLTMVVK